MRVKMLSLLLIVPSWVFAESDVAHLESLNERASQYRLLVIECAVDFKISKLPINQVKSCIQLYAFTESGYPQLKSSVIRAKENVRKEGVDNGLRHPGLRKKLSLIMSAKSHMNIAGTILNRISQ